MVAAFYTQTPKPQSSLANSPTKTRAYSCAICKSTSHPQQNCQVISDVSKRYDIAKRDKLCFNCLGSSAMILQNATNFVSIVLVLIAQETVGQNIGAGTVKGNIILRFVSPQRYMKIARKRPPVLVNPKKHCIMWNTLNLQTLMTVQSKVVQYFSKQLLRM
jgi:hypothetical protein